MRIDRYADRTGNAGSRRASERLRAFLLAALLGGCALPALAADAPPAQLGANLPGISDYSATPVYVNLVHQARRFGTPDAPWDENAELGGDGWPVADFGIFLSTGQAGVAGTGGTYKVSFTGRANVAPVASAGASVVNQAYDAVAHRTTLDLVVDTGVPSGGNQLALKFTGTQGGIRNLKLIRPGYDPDDPPLFTSSFVDHIARFRTVRFMDWLRTNDNNGVARWATRPTPDRVPYASPLGVPWEHVVALANRTGQDIWINIPLRADDDYVRNLARLLKSTLNAGSRVYVEYSNELWNPGFAQFGGNLELARAEVEADPASVLAFDSATRAYTVADPNVLAFRRIANRLKEIGDIFAGVFGAPAMLTRIRPVLAAQVVQPHVAKIGLDFIRDTYGPPAQYFHALASAPYFNMGAQQSVDGLTPDEVLAALERSASAVPAVNFYEDNRALATWHGLEWLAYEGGSDTFGAGSIAAKAAANLDSRMQALCERYLHGWYAAGGGLFMWYTAGAGRWDHPHGAWELTTDLALADTPKLRCLDAVLAAPAPATAGRKSVPGSFRGIDYAGRAPSRVDPVLRHLHPGSFVDYLIHASAAGVYTLSLVAEVAAAGNTVDIAVNGRTMASDLALTAVGGWGTPLAQPRATIILHRGFNVVRLTTRTETSGYWVHRVDVLATRSSSESRPFQRSSRAAAGDTAASRSRRPRAASCRSRRSSRPANVGPKRST